MDLNEATEGWISQPKKSACLPTCIYNVLLDVSKDPRNVPPLDYKYQKIEKEVGYDQELGTPVDDAVEGVKRMLQRDKIIQWSVSTTEGKTIKQGTICDKLSSKNCSYPIVSLGPEYLSDRYQIKFEGVPQTWPSHCVIVVECKGNKVTIFDPYSPAGSNDCLYTLTKYNFEKYCLSADPRNWAMWFEMKVLPMENYFRGDRK